MANIKDLPSRSWPRLREQWQEHIPGQDELAFPGVTIDRLLALQHINLEDKLVVQTIPQLREVTFALALFLRRKAIYCIEAAAEMNQRGFPTWSSLLMYDACFFSAKSSCYLLGVTDVGRDTPFYLDIFYEESKKKHLIDVGHQAFRLPERLTHNMLWTIFARLMNTLKSDDDFEDYIRQLRRNDYSTFSKERNRLFYTCIGWSREHDIDTSDLSGRAVYEANLNFLQDPDNSSSEYHQLYNHGALTLMTLLDHLLSDIGKLVPVVGSIMATNSGAPKVKNFEFA